MGRREVDRHPTARSIQWWHQAASNATSRSTTRLIISAVSGPVAGGRVASCNMPSTTWRRRQRHTLLPNYQPRVKSLECDLRNPNLQAYKRALARVPQKGKLRHGKNTGWPRGTGNAGIVETEVGAQAPAAADWVLLVHLRVDHGQPSEQRVRRMFYPDQPALSPHFRTAVSLTMSL